MSKQISKYHCFIGVTLIVTLLLLLLGSLSPKRTTTVSYIDQQCKITDEQFALSWIHSVDKTPWVEYYRRDKAAFLLTETEFRTFGAGVPHDGEVIPTTNGMIRYRVNLPMTEINWVVDKEVQSTIVLSNGGRFEIFKETDRYQPIYITNQSLNVWQRLFIRNCHESY